MTSLVPEKQSVRPGYLEMLLIALVVAGVSLFAYDRWFVPRVVAFDLKGYLRTQQALLASGEITEAQWQQGLDRLEQVFREQPPNRTILLKEVVLKNGREPELRIP
jgi:hypothetical protein